MKSCRKEAKISVSSRLEEDDLIQEINLQKLSSIDDHDSNKTGFQTNQEEPKSKHHHRHRHLNTTNQEEEEEDYHDFLVSLPTPDEIEGAQFDEDEGKEKKDHVTLESLSSKCPLCKMKGNMCFAPGQNSQCLHSLYGQPKSPSVLRDIMKSPSHCDPNGGLIWKVYLVPDDYNVNYEKNASLKRLPKPYYDAEQKCIKPRRGHIMATYSEFMSSLQQVSVDDTMDAHDTRNHNDNDDGDDLHPTMDIEIYKPRSKWIFSGVLNGWPALQTLELLTIEYKRPLLSWNVHWSAQEYEKAHEAWTDTNVNIPAGTTSTAGTMVSHKQSSASAPTIPTYFGISEVRARLRAPAHSADGWSKNSPGFVFWFEGKQTRKEGEDRLLYGTNIIRQWEQDSRLVPSPKCIKVHQISHRYATGNKKQFRDYLTYHSLALLEWDHGKFCTVVELAYLGGVGGYNGRSNWIEDKNESPSSLYKAMPPEMIHPWKVDKSEIRCFDVNVQSLSMFFMYMQKYTGQDKRFIDVHHTFSHEVRLSFCAREHIVQYLINYIRRIRSYSEIRRNCQTFAADFCAFLAGKKDVNPFHPINRGGYRNQVHTFMYDSTMYNVHHHHHHHHHNHHE